MKIGAVEKSLRERYEAKQELMKSSMLSVEIELKQKNNEIALLARELDELRENKRLSAGTFEESGKIATMSCPNCRLF